MQPHQWLERLLTRPRSRGGTLSSSERGEGDMDASCGGDRALHGFARAGQPAQTQAQRDRTYFPSPSSSHRHPRPAAGSPLQVTGGERAGVRGGSWEAPCCVSHRSTQHSVVNAQFFEMRTRQGFPVVFKVQAVWHRLGAVCRKVSPDFSQSGLGARGAGQNMLKRFLQRIVGADFIRCSLRCNDWSGERVAVLRPRVLLDVGCGDGSLLFRYLDYRPGRLCGIEAAPALKAKAAERGLEVVSFDLNSPWPYDDETFDVVHSSQVIEHLHNTRLFVQELYRVLKPGGTALVTSENLTSFLNLGAMVLGYTPFTLMRVCGWFLGNPLGLHYGEEPEEDVPITDPALPVSPGISARSAYRRPRNSLNESVSRPRLHLWG